MVTTRTITLDTVGGAGAATASGTIAVPPSKLLGIFIDFTTEPVTTDVTVANLGRNVLAVVNVNTDKFYPVRENVVKNDGTNAPAGDNPWDVALVQGEVAISVAQADPVTGGIIVTLYLEV